MGLKTTNFVVKRTGQYLPNAYAKLRTLVLNSDDTVTATFGIHESRAKMETEGLDPYEIVSIDMGKWDRKYEHLDEFAYKVAKEKVEEYYEYDEATHQQVLVTKYSELYGWENDIVNRRYE